MVDFSGRSLVVIDHNPEVTNWYPSGVCVRLNDEICITNYNDKCIHCYSTDGKYLKCVFKGLQDPRGLALMDMDKKLLVTEWNSIAGTVKILTRA